MSYISEYRQIKACTKNKKKYLKKKKDLKRQLRKWLKIRKYENKRLRKTAYRIVKYRCNLLDLKEHRKRYLDKCSS